MKEQMNQGVSRELKHRDHYGRIVRLSSFHREIELAKDALALLDECENLRRDKERLDWLESRTTEVHFWNKNGNQKYSFIEDWDATETSDALREASTLREAIDEAMGKERGCLSVKNAE